MSAERFTAIYTRAITDPPNQDVLTMGLHFVDSIGFLTGHAPFGLNDTIRAAVETAWTTFDAVWKPQRKPTTTLTSFVWHDAWPANPPPNAALRTTSVSIVGTGTGTGAYPPQVACNMTLETVNRRHWGRFSIGDFSAGTYIDAQGMLTSAITTTWANALDAFLESCTSAGAIPVVYRRPQWTDKSHTTLVHGGEFYPVIASRVDRVLDIIRRRRYEHTNASHRTVNPLSAATANPTLYGTHMVDAA